MIFMIFSVSDSKIKQQEGPQQKYTRKIATSLEYVTNFTKISHIIVKAIIVVFLNRRGTYINTRVMNGHTASNRLSNTTNICTHMNDTRIAFSKSVNLIMHTYRTDYSFTFHIRCVWVIPTFK